MDLSRGCAWKARCQESTELRERRYSRWFVTHCLWTDLEECLKVHRDKALAVFQARGRYGTPLWSALERCAEEEFRFARRFYRATAKENGVLLDVSTFFKRPGQYDRLVDYWDQETRKNKDPLLRAIGRVQDILNEEAS